MKNVSTILNQIKSQADISQYNFADIYNIVETQKQLLDSFLKENIPLNEKDMINKLINDIFPKLIKRSIDKHKEDKKKTWDNIKDILKNNMYNAMLDSKVSLLDEIRDLVSYDFKTGDPEAEKFLLLKVKENIKYLFKQNLLEWSQNLSSHIFLDYQHSKDIEKQLKYLMEQGYLDQESYNYAHGLTNDAYIRQHFKEVYQKKDILIKTICHAQKTNDISIPIAILIDEINDLIYNRNEQLAGNQDETTFFLKLCKDVEESYKQEIYKLCESYLNVVISEEIDYLNTKYEVDTYQQNNNFKQRQSLLKFLSEDQQSNLFSILQDIQKEKLLSLKLNLPQIKIRGDEVHFGSVIFPKFSYIPKTLWKPAPEITGNNVLLNIKDHKSGKVIKPCDQKKLRPNNPYRVTENEYKDMIKKYSDFQKTSDCKNLLNQEVKLQDELSNIQDKESTEYKESKALLQEVRKKLEENIPHYFRVIRKLNTIPGLFSSLKKPPKLYPNVVIPPYVMGNLHKIVRLAEYQLLTQDGIGILEGEAGVGKNVALDIFAHYTGRPVFNFSCNKKTTKDDITYVRLLDKDGTYQLNSEVLNALDTDGAILLFDEINSLPHEVAKMLNSLFDARRTMNLPHSNDGKKAKNSVLMFGTMNPNTHVYKGNNPLSAETYSRSFFQFFDYPSLMTKESIVNYDEALMTYKNVPYYYKLLSKEGFIKNDIDEIKYYIVREYNGNGLREDQKDKIHSMQKSYISDKEFIQAWNDIINGKEKDRKKYNQEFISGIESIKELLMYAHYFRSKYIKNMTGIDKTRNKITSSVSQRDLNKMAYLLCLGYTAKQAFIEVYINSIPSLGDRETIKNELMTLTADSLNTEVLEYSNNAAMKLENLFNAT